MGGGQAFAGTQAAGPGLRQRGLPLLDAVQVFVERCGVVELCRRNAVFRWEVERGAYSDSAVGQAVICAAKRLHNEATGASGRRVLCSARDF